jgi:hypothetical protein
MYAQLGSTVFDGLKGFVSYGDEEESVLVEHALIGRKPKLQGSGLGLQSLTIAIYINQEFCVVKDEISKLRNSLRTYEILPLLWGNGTLEASFVITKLAIKNEFQDELGNLIAANLELTLKESVADNVVAPPTQGIATGTTQPVTKSKRKNKPSCNQLTSSIINDMQSNAASVDGICRNYAVFYLASNNIAIQRGCANIMTDATQIVQATQTSSSCLYNNTNVQNAARSVHSSASTLSIDAANASINNVPTDNVTMQSNITTLAGLLNSNQKGAILRT